MADWLVSTSAGRAFTVGFIAMLTFAPYWLCKGVLALTYEKKVPTDKVIASYIPFYNKIVTDDVYFGHPSLGLGSVIGIGLVIVRFVVSFISQNSVLYHITAILMLIGFALWYICNVAYSVVVIQESRYMKLPGAILWSIIYPLGYYYYSNVIVKEIIAESKKGLR